MNCYSIKNPSLRVPIRQAVLEGLARDGSLYMPERIVRLPDSAFALSFPELVLVHLEQYFDDIPRDHLESLVKEALNFPLVYKELDEKTFVLELFHGPSAAFKDVGARVLARILSYYAQASEGLHVIVATSGDTGSAVGQAFYAVEGVKVSILFPKGKISPFQEEQICSIGANVKAIAVDGSFDDCQRLVKAAFNDKQLRKRLSLSSANSINIARLLPQVTYYLKARQLFPNKPLVFSVPSGNFGNLFAALFAKRIGLDNTSFIAATNLNDLIPRYLKSGEYEEKAAISTYSNAMDVAKPSNFPRIMDLYGQSLAALRKDLQGESVSDDETLLAIKFCKEHYNYLLDPHGAVAFAALNRHKEQKSINIFLETAHPCKFQEVVKRVYSDPIPLSDNFQQSNNKNAVKVNMSNCFFEFKNYLLSC